VITLRLCFGSDKLTESVGILRPGQGYNRRLTGGDAEFWFSNGGDKEFPGFDRLHFDRLGNACSAPT
jgi:hypothetical protein